jgi:hypothetical protein
VASRKGSPNKIGAQVKDNLVAVFTRLGSTAAMAAWAKDHQSEFYKMYAALAPKEIDATVRHVDESDLTDAELADIATGRGAGATEATDVTQEPGELH